MMLTPFSSIRWIEGLARSALTLEGSIGPAMSVAPDVRNSESWLLDSTKLTTSWQALGRGRKYGFLCSTTCEEPETNGRDMENGPSVTFCPKRFAPGPWFTEEAGWTFSKIMREILSAK